MNERTRWRTIQVARLLCLITALGAASACSAQVDREAATESEPMYTLDAATPNARHVIDVSDRAAPAKFVRVKLSEIVNPARRSLTFNVFFEPAGGQRIRLGSFSPFPADNPGAFIVATQGKVTGKGSIVVSMTAAGEAANGALQAAVENIELVDN